MLKNILRIPNTFDSHDSRQRQVMNIALILIIASGLVVIILALVIIYYDLDPHGSAEDKKLLLPGALIILISIILYIANRSAQIPGWATRLLFVTLLAGMLTQADLPQELYNGRSLILWVLPIMFGAILFPPKAVFVVATIICGFIWLFWYYPNGSTNYYTIVAIFFIASVSWLSMSIANNAIRDARREAANNKAILENMGEGLLVLDMQGKFLSANPALLKMIPAEDLQEIISRPLEKTLQWKRKIYSVTASEVPEVGTVAVLRDETRRHETERARDALIATASHELRTPLAAIMNYLELLVMRGKTGKVNAEEFTEYLMRALENSKRLQGLVNNILDQAQIQAGALELKNRAFDLRALLERTRQLLDALIKEKNLTYELKIAPDVPSEILGDVDRLHQVLVNLIGNAIKFTNEGGVKVKVYKTQKGKLSIEVTDSGPGIPSEQLPDIFEAFRRGSNYAQRERQGAGLGLSIVKEIVTRMGGEISAASHLGVGSVFTVTLPIETL